MSPVIGISSKLLSSTAAADLGPYFSAALHQSQSSALGESSRAIVPAEMGVEAALGGIGSRFPVVLMV